MSVTLRRAVCLSLASAALSCSAPVAGQACEAPELVGPSPPQYASLICSSLELAEEGDFAEAAKYLESALDVHLYEYPNYRALPRLALYYARSGNTIAGDLMLEEARLALSIVLGLISCVSNDEGFHLESGGVRLESASGPAAVERMCGEAYESFYAQTDLQSIRQDLPLLEAYYSAQDLLRSR